MGSMSEPIRPGPVDPVDFLATDALLDDMETSPDAWQVQFRERQHPNPAIRGAIEVGWVGWEKVGRSLVERCFDTTPERAGTAAHLTVLVGGLGAGHTLRAALDLPLVRRVVVAEIGVGIVHHELPSPTRAVDPAVAELHRRLKHEFDPRRRLNPGVDVLAAA